ncbi:MAG: response regulator [Elusimicrobia bacterium]|nr:response regulator [Elusimicrobiota bacterium]
MSGEDEPLRVLVVEDLADVRNYLMRFLARRRCSLEGAADAAEAVARCGRERYELILLDERLPDKPGSEIIAELKRRQPDASIVLLTGALTGSLDAEARRLGADACLAKPPDFDALEALVAARRAKRGS